ncbi:uncharacterized protein LOC114304743 isoform X3 [Camellia sinensis]|uniref:uncharacterized protein LOC114304743 isoform X3 n=1 Tax=Camellia sinensis TaxID=4442 RepID=UPI0010355A44|nr:uncharacterized protein LOC114304743 isoform X3 [Camellia sinensis]
MRSVNNNALDTISAAATAIASARTQASVQIRMLDLVLKASPEDSNEPQTARILLYKLFYDQTDQGMTQFLLNQIKSFDTHKQAKRQHWVKERREKEMTLSLFSKEDYE